jgi:hypothetical protein
MTKNKSKQEVSDEAWWRRKKTKIPVEERILINRLMEEVYARVTEMAMIFGRLHRWKGIAPVRSFQFQTKSTAQSSDIVMKEMEVIVNPETGDCVLYDHEEGTCIPCADA